MDDLVPPQEHRVTAVEIGAATPGAAAAVLPLAAWIVSGWRWRWWPISAGARLTDSPEIL